MATSVCFLLFLFDSLIFYFHILKTSKNFFVKIQFGSNSCSHFQCLLTI